MYKCTNCSWEGEEPVHKNHKFCPVCGDNTEFIGEVEVKKEPKKSIVNRIKEVTEDLMDDGKRNYSNNPRKKSPGRKKKR